MLFFFWPKNSSAKFQKFCGVFAFLLFLLKKCSFSVKDIFECLGAIFFLRKKKWIPDSKFFTCFMPKNIFFQFLDPPDFRAEDPKNILAHFFSPFRGVEGYPGGYGGDPMVFFWGGGTPTPPKSASGLHTPMVS